MTLLMQRLMRTKSLDIDDIFSTKLKRCFSICDVTMLAIGHMMGSGIYVLTATVTKDVAGPAVVVSFVISGAVSCLIASCYAELGSRYPKSGSAYYFTYVTLGELPAFFVGWCMILANVLCISIVSRFCSDFIDFLLDGEIQIYIDSIIGMNTSTSQSMDVLAFTVVVAITGLMALGARTTSRINSICTLVNLVVIAITIGVGFYFSDIENWANRDTGGFIPYGFSGIVASSIPCFYSFIGFDVATTSAEEAKDPQRAIPIAMTACMTVAIASYLGVSAALSLMVNYRDIRNDMGLLYAFEDRGAVWTKVIVLIGSICAMVTSMIGSIFSLTRVVFSMADDGLLFSGLGTINKKSKEPLQAMIVVSALSAVLSLIVDAQALVELLLVGCFISYLAVSSSVIILRYRPTETATANHQENSSIGKCSIRIGEHELAGQIRKSFAIIRSCTLKVPGRMVTALVIVMSFLMVALCVFLRTTLPRSMDLTGWNVAVLMTMCFGILVSLLGIAIHQQSLAPLRCKVPFVPLIPSISMFIDVLFMVNLELTTWMQFAAWSLIGLCVYFGYGITHSRLDNVARLNDFPGQSNSSQTLETGSFTSTKHEDDLAKESAFVTHL